MRSHAKAPSTFGALCLCVLGLVALLGSGTPSAGAVSCPNEAIRAQQGSTYLPDCRAYEQVTPVDKEASNDMFGNGTQANEWGYAAPGGDKVLLLTKAAMGPNPSGFIQGYVFSRSTSGWNLTPVNPAGGGAARFYPNLLSPDLSSFGILRTEGPSIPGTLAGPETAEALEVGPTGGPYTVIQADAAGGEAENFTGAMSFMVGSSSDFSHVVFQSMKRTLVPTAEGQDEHTRAIYEYANGQLTQVNLKTEGTLVNTCGAMVGRGPTMGFEHNAVSADGSKVFFVSPDPNQAGVDNLFGWPIPPACEEPSHLYVRIGGNETVDVSEPEPGVVDSEGFQPVEFMGASEDGSRVFFKTRTQLTSDDSGHDYDLYEYNFGSESLTRISHGNSGTGQGDVNWDVVADDGSAVYFAQRGDSLAPGAPSETENYNYYRYDTETGETAFIATGAGQIDWSSHSTQGTGPNDIGVNWYAAPNGEFLVFFSRANITGQNPTSAGELYRYDAASEAVSCVSCPPEPESGDAHFADLSSRNATVIEGAIRSPRPISDDGSRVFFDTPAALVAQDTNGVRDVYEWHDGAVSLISSGKDGTDSVFVDSSADGRDVFFGTHGRLALTDTDFLGDLYDAREEGGLSNTAASECSGESCQGSPGEAARETSPGSASFVGTGNIHQLHRCRRGTHRVRRHGKVRCVRKHRHHHRAGANRGGTK